MKIKTTVPEFTIRFATEEDVPLILHFIHQLAKYEKLLHEVVTTEKALRIDLFGDRRVAEVILGYWNDAPVSFALFFHNFSTFLGKRGLYLEDLYVNSHMRGRGIGKIMLAYIARLAMDRACGRLEWSVLDWNTSAIQFYRSIGSEEMSEWRLWRISGKDLEKLADTFDR